MNNRVAILLDVNELFHSVAKKYPGRKFNYAQFLKHQSEIGDVHHAVACCDSALEKGRNFVAMLRANNYNVLIGDRKVWFTVESMRMVDEVGVFIFGTGNEAYIPLFDFLMRRRKDVFLISPNTRKNKFDVTGILDIEEQYLF